MSTSTAHQFGIESESRFAGSHAIVPVLIGLMAPVMVVSAIDPRALASASVLIHIYLFAIFVIATAAYIITVVDQGEVTRVVFDKDARQILVERTGLLAKKSIEVPFSDVASLRIETRYDDDGYKTAVPMLVLSTRETIQLPAGITEADVATMRALIGRG